MAHCASSYHCIYIKFNFLLELSLCPLFTLHNNLKTPLVCNRKCLASSPSTGCICSAVDSLRHLWSASGRPGGCADLNWGVTTCQLIYNGLCQVTRIRHLCSMYSIVWHGQATQAYSYVRGRRMRKNKSDQISTFQFSPSVAFRLFDHSLWQSRIQSHSHPWE